MVAGLFAQHGVWAGHADVREGKWNPKGSFENKAVKAMLLSRFGYKSPFLSENVEPEPTQGIERVIMRTVRGDGYDSGPWLFKCSCLYHKIFAGMNPTIITVRRPTGAVRESFLRTRWTNAKDIDWAIASNEAVLDQLEARGAMRVDSPLLIEGDYSQIEPIFERCGLQFDKAKADEWIAPELWHFK